MIFMFLLAACNGETTAPAIDPNANGLNVSDSQSENTGGDSAQEGNAEGNDAVVEENSNIPTEPSVESDEEQPVADDSHLPDWYAHQFTDAATGQVFSINDFRGKVVLVENMAMW